MYGCKVYTAIAAQKWRVLPPGQKVDKAFSWSKDPRAAWRGVVKFVNSYKPVLAKRERRAEPRAWKHSLTYSLLLYSYPPLHPTHPRPRHPPRPQGTADVLIIFPLLTPLARALSRATHPPGATMPNEK